MISHVVQALPREKRFWIPDKVNMNTDTLTTQRIYFRQWLSISHLQCESSVCPRCMNKYFVKNMMGGLYFHEFPLIGNKETISKNEFPHQLDVTVSRLYIFYINIIYLRLYRLSPGKRGYSYPTRWIQTPPSTRIIFYGYISGNGHPSPISNVNPAAAKGK